MKAVEVKKARLARRVRRVRKQVRGTPDRPRLAVTKSLSNLYAQIIDDVSGRTLCALSTQAPDVRSQTPYGGNKKAAEALGKLLGERATGLGVSAVCFDRRGRKFHGRVKALADAARAAGLKF